MAAQPCYRHAARLTGTSCTRCSRPICPDCMIEAPVGHHCPTCVHEGSADMRRVRRVAFAGGGRRAATAVVVTALIAVNVAVFLAGLADPSITRRFADNALLVAAGEWYRMVTAAFLHAGLLHLGFNMLGLFVFGTQVEAALGPARFLALYLVAAAGGSACSHFFGAPETFGVGASGAVFGVFGAFYVLARARGLDTSQVAGLIVLNLFIGLAVPGIDNAAHAGGLVTGAVVALGYQQAARLRGGGEVAAQIAAVAGVVAVLVGVTIVRVEQLQPLLRGALG